MSLYRHVATKDELVAVMTDVAIGRPPDINRVQGGWRRRLEAYARHLWESWQVHPWLPAATVGGRVMGPNEVGWVEQAVRAILEAVDTASPRPVRHVDDGLGLTTILDGLELRIAQRRSDAWSRLPGAATMKACSTRIS